MSDKAEAYKAGHVESGNWNWAVGIPATVGHIQIATVNTHACYLLKVNGMAVAEIMAKAYNEVYPTCR